MDQNLIQQRAQNTETEKLTQLAVKKAKEIEKEKAYRKENKLIQKVRNQ